MPPLLGGALQMLAREIDWRLFSDEQANQIITPYNTIQYNTMEICIAPLVASESEALGDSVYCLDRLCWSVCRGKELRF